jgi:hypothetical protein
MGFCLALLNSYFVSFEVIESMVLCLVKHED